MGRFWGNARPSKLSVTPQLPHRSGDQELPWQGDGADITWRPRRVRNRDTEAQQADCSGKNDARMRSAPSGRQLTKQDASPHTVGLWGSMSGSPHLTFFVKRPVDEYVYHNFQENTH